MTTVTINDIVIRGATRIEAEGAWDAPSETVERGFDFSSYAGQEPRSVTLGAWLGMSTYRELEQLRREGEPFSASVGATGLPNAKLTGLSVEETADNPQVQFPNQAPEDALELRLTIEEIQVAELDTADISFELGDDQMCTGANSTSEQRGSSTEDDPDVGTGVVDSLESAADSLSNTLFG